MFGKRRVAAASSPADGHHDEPGSSYTTRSDAYPPASPLQVTFDFELGSTSSPSTLGNWQPNEQSPPSSNGRFERRLEISPKGLVSTDPPILPPIPRVASQFQKDAKMRSAESLATGATIVDDGIVGHETNFGETFNEGPRFRRKGSFEKPVDYRSYSRPGSSAASKLQEARGSTAIQIPQGPGPSTRAQPQFTGTRQPTSEAFRHEGVASVSSFYSTNRSNNAVFHRSGDSDSLNDLVKPPPGHAIFQQATQSTPDLFSTLWSPASSGSPSSNPAPQSFRSPLSAVAGPSDTAWPQLHKALTNPALLQEPPAHQHQGLSVSTESSFSSMSHDGPQPHTVTIGTPYDETSPAYPLPHHVFTRPNIITGTSTLGGVTVPTHHSTATLPRPEVVKSEKGEKRRTRLLSPFALLAKRRNAQDEDALVKERAAQEQALARQKDVAAVGVSKLPEDFDPRIKGKVIHDFSAPRQSHRNYSHGDITSYNPERHLSPSNAASPTPGGTDRTLSNPPTSTNIEPPRRSSHVPVFVEHLTENPDHARRLSSMNAERLENKDFLQRASYVSSVSAFSQDSFAHPPFGRRSQQLELASGGITGDHESKKSSDQSSSNHRDSSSSSLGIGSISRQSAVPAIGVRRRNSSQMSSGSGGSNHHPRDVLAPASSTSLDMVGKRGTFDTVSSLSSANPSSPPAEPLIDNQSSEQDLLASHPVSGSQMTSVATAHVLSEASEHPPSPIRPEDELPLRISPESSRKSRSSLQPEILIPPRLNSVAESSLPSPSLASSQGTPVLETAETAAAPVSFQPRVPPRLVDKSVSKSRHSTRSSRGFKHHVSNASRFSFQFGGSAAEEQALEEKHRKMTESVEIIPSDRPTSLRDYDDDDDYFDEDAMDDMDEMEMQASTLEDEFPPSTFASSSAPLSLSQARAQLQPDSESDSEVENGITHVHPVAYRPIERGSFSTKTAFQPHSQNIHAAGASSVTSYRFPQSAGFNPYGAQPIPAVSPLSQHHGTDNRQRDGSASSADKNSSKTAVMRPVDPNSDANLDLAALRLDQPPAYRRTSSTVEGNDSIARASSQRLRFPHGSDTGLTYKDIPSGSPVNEPGDVTALGIGLQPTNRFIDRDVIPTNEQDIREDQLYHGDSPFRGAVESIANHHSFAGESHSQHSQLSGMNPALGYNSQEDEMYFDDGGFGPDMESRDLGMSIDEDRFDDESFLRGNPANERIDSYVQQETATDVLRNSAATFKSDGPYPSFALPNPTRARQRDSQMLLEDLPLYTIGTDPKLIPQRNPSEDAKRLGISDKFPPLPPPPGNPMVSQQISASLDAYHAALAEAANRAAAEGRFQRMPSSSTTRSVSEIASLLRDDEEDQVSTKKRSVYSADGVTTALDNGRTYTESRASLDPHLRQASTQGTQLTNFDFGFDGYDSFAPDDRLMSDSVIVDDDNDFDDADMIAAANSQLLESDDEGFYGQEFGFYARARANSGDTLESVNGGFFGEDGDDGITRNKSIKEPNLTPITERSEFSTRNSFIGPGVFGPPSAGPHRLSVSPLVEDEITSFDEVTSFEELRRLRANAFGGSNGSLRSDGTRGSPRSAGAHPAPYTSVFGGEPMSLAYSTGSSGSSNAASASKVQPLHASGRFEPISPPLGSPHQDHDATPRRQPPNTSTANRKAGGSGTTTSVPRIQTFSSHSRKSSGGTADSVTYVREQENGQPRWVVERRRTGEQGQLELIGREVVQGGWI